MRALGKQLRSHCVVSDRAEAAFQTESRSPRLPLNVFSDRVIQTDSISGPMGEQMRGFDPSGTIYDTTGTIYRPFRNALIDILGTKARSFRNERPNATRVFPAILSVSPPHLTF